MRHIACPLRLDARGRLAAADHEEWLTGLIGQVLFTRPGERVNRPNFGAGTAGLVFEPLGDGLAEATSALVMGALQMELGDLLRVEAVSVAVVDTVVEVTVTYSSVGAPAGESWVATVSGGAG